MGMLPELAKVATENVGSSYHGRLAWNYAGGGLVFGPLQAFAKSDGVICRLVPILADNAGSIGRLARAWCSDRESMRGDGGVTLRSEVKHVYKSRNH